MRDTGHHTHHTTEIFRQAALLAIVVCATVLVISRPYLVNAVRTEKVDAFWLLLGPGIFSALFLMHLLCEYFMKEHAPWTLADFFRMFFGFLIIALIFPSSLREYRIRKLPNLGPETLEIFFNSDDPRIRALTVLAASRDNFDNNVLGALIHKGLLDKDPLVQQAAKLVIEDNFAIRLRNGAAGNHQAQSIKQDVGPSALLMRERSSP